MIMSVKLNESVSCSNFSRFLFFGRKLETTNLFSSRSRNFGKRTKRSGGYFNGSGTIVSFRTNRKSVRNFIRSSSCRRFGNGTVYLRTFDRSSRDKRVYLFSSLFVSNSSVNFLRDVRALRVISKSCVGYIRVCIEFNAVSGLFNQTSAIKSRDSRKRIVLVLFAVKQAVKSGSSCIIRKIANVFGYVTFTFKFSRLYITFKLCIDFAENLGFSSRNVRLRCCTFNVRNHKYDVSL